MARNQRLGRYFEIISYDNLALQQLGINAQDSALYQGEHSLYIDAVARTVHPSSREPGVPWKDNPLQSYFLKLEASR